MKEYKEYVIGIIGSRRRNSGQDRKIIFDYLTKSEHFEMSTGRGQQNIKRIITGDCEIGGDKFARDYCMYWSPCIRLTVKYKKHPATGKRWISSEVSGWVQYWEFVKMCYTRDEEIAKEPFDYLIALVAPDRKGGTENIIKHFKRLNPKNWKNKLILL